LKVKPLEREKIKRPFDSFSEDCQAYFKFCDTNSDKNTVSPE